MYSTEEELDDRREDCRLCLYSATDLSLIYDLLIDFDAISLGIGTTVLAVVCWREHNGGGCVLSVWRKSDGTV